VGPQPGQSPPHVPMLSVPITVLLYNGPLLCGFNVPILFMQKLSVYVVNHFFALMGIKVKNEETKNVIEIMMAHSLMLNVQILNVTHLDSFYVWL